MIRDRIILISAATTMASLLVAGPAMEMPSRASFRHSFYEAPRRKDDGGIDRLTKREKREMMQRDFAYGGARQGRRRRQRMYHCRHKE